VLTSENAIFVPAKVKERRGSRMDMIMKFDDKRLKNLIEVKNKDTSFGLVKQKSGQKQKSTANLLQKDSIKEKGGDAPARHVNESEKNIERYILNMNPFKNLDLQREGSSGVSSFLPSLSEHKQAILSGKMSTKDLRGQLNRSKSFKSKGNLLGQIKEEHKKEDKAGVVPKDLGFGLLKDLIDLIDDE
jgi:hypothetical protein